MSQQDTAMATATSASSAVITSAIINPILDTQTSSSPREPVRGSMRDSDLLSIVRIALDCTCKEKCQYFCLIKYESYHNLFSELASEDRGLTTSFPLLPSVSIAARTVLGLALAEAHSDVALEPDVVAGWELEGIEGGSEDAKIPFICPLPEDGGVSGTAIVVSNLDDRQVRPEYIGTPTANSPNIHFLHCRPWCGRHSGGRTLRIWHLAGHQPSASGCLQSLRWRCHCRLSCRCACCRWAGAPCWRWCRMLSTWRH